MNLMPKLKELVFYFLFRIRSINPAMGLATVLLEESSMVTFKCMQTLMDAEIVCLAHSEKKILDEMKNFLTATKKMKDEMGSMWSFLRVIRPGDLSLATSKFPNLARAAVVYYKKYIDPSPTFDQVVFPGGATIPNLDELARVKVPDDCLFTVPVLEGDSFTADQREMANIIKLDLSKWKITRALRNQINRVGNEDPVAMLLRALGRQENVPANPA